MKMLCSRETVSKTGRLKFYVHDHARSFRLQLIGNLCGADVQDLDGCWKTAEQSVNGRKIQVDLRMIGDVDDAGRNWLCQMAALENCEFVATEEAWAALPDPCRVRKPEALPPSHGKHRFSFWARVRGNAIPSATH